MTMKANFNCHEIEIKILENQDFMIFKKKITKKINYILDLEVTKEDERSAQRDGTWSIKRKMKN